LLFGLTGHLGHFAPNLAAAEIANENATAQNQISHQKHQLKLCGLSTPMEVSILFLVSQTQTHLNIKAQSRLKLKTQTRFKVSVLVVTDFRLDLSDSGLVMANRNFRDLSDK
jgi:hypothetical protein